MNKNQYINFHKYKEAKNAFILSEEKKYGKTNKRSETKKSKENSYGVANAGSNKIESKQKKKYQQINTN